MIIRKTTRRIKEVVVTMAVCTFGATSSVMATSNYPGHDYPPRASNNVPAIYMSRIDIENNQIEFTVDTERLDDKTISNIGVGWAKNNSYLMENSNILEYETVETDWSEKVLKKSTDELASYLARSSEFEQVYIIDADVDIKSNELNKMFYIVDFTDGSKWINNASYEDCGQAWVPGLNCVAGRFSSMKEYDNVVYVTAGAPEKFIGTNPEPTEPEPVEPEPITPDPTVSDDVGPTTPEPVVDDPEPVVSDPEVISENREIENEEKAQVNDNKNTVVLASAPQTIDTVQSKNITLDDDEEDNNIYEELTEAPEGAGETTLDIPMLGGTNKCDEFNWLPYFIAGTALGAISIWFLFSIIKKVKNDRKTRSPFNL